MGCIFTQKMLNEVKSLNLIIAYFTAGLGRDCLKLEFIGGVING